MTQRGFTACFDQCVSIAGSAHCDLAAFRDNLFEFAMGGRVLNLWGDAWGCITRNDMRHQCGMADVREYCVSWPLTNAFEFDRWLSYAVSYPNGNLKEWKKQYKRYVTAEEADPSVELSGVVELDGLGAKSSIRRHARCECQLELMTLSGGRARPKRPLVCWTKCKRSCKWHG